MMRRHIASAMGGMGLATAFFMPIAAAGTIDAPLLMWTSRHTVELVCAWAMYSTVAAVALAWLGRDGRPRLGSALILILSTPSLLSLLTITGRNTAVIGEGADSVRLLAVGTVIAGLTVTAALWVLKPKILLGMFRVILPFGLLLLVPGARALLAVPMPNLDAPPAARVTTGSDRCNNVYVLLFDELAYDAVFSDGHITLNSLAGRVSTARVYHRAQAATMSTDTSITAYASVSPKRGANPRAGGSGVFRVAQAAGMETEVAGWYFPYCEALGRAATRCRSYSMYNAATAYDRFSLVAPFETVLNIWPYQMPTGLLKRSFAVRLHQAELDALTAHAAAPPPAGPVFRWVHFNVPHIPWLRDTGPFALHAFDQTRERYLQQVQEVDRALETTLSAIERQPTGRSTTVVITADHGSRRGHAGAPLHVPLIVWTRDGRHEDVYDEGLVADVLKRVVAGACRQ